MKKVIGLLLVLTMGFGMILSVNAQDTSKYQSENYALIKDTETGEITRIELSAPDVKITKNANGETVYESTVSIEDNYKHTRASQSASDTLSGYKGEVTITYTNDGTYACLTKATGSWTRVSGTATMTNKDIVYGQSLGTNSKNGYTNFSGSSVTVTTNYKKGKFGSGHFLGANINGKVNKKNITVVCNVSL